MNRATDTFTATCSNKHGLTPAFMPGNRTVRPSPAPDIGRRSKSGFPTSIVTTGIRNLEYGFDTLTGNLNWRKDVAKGLQEIFTYDNMMKNRLETWQVNVGTAYGVNDTNNGNINTKTGLGTFSYNAPQPHAVSEIENTGNLVSKVNQVVRYTSFNKVDNVGMLKMVYTKIAYFYFFRINTFYIPA